MRKFRRMATVISVVSLAAALTSVAPVHAQGGRASRMAGYDTATETTIQGIVTEVKNVNGPVNGRGMQGMHIFVNTGGDTIAVHLGPAWYASEQKVAISAGDVLKILGARVSMGGTKAIIARRVEKGDIRWTFRDETGRPMWAGRHH